MSIPFDSSQGGAPLLSVENLVVEYPSKRFRAKPFRALTDINITIGQGETLGLVGGVRFGEDHPG